MYLIDFDSTPAKAFLHGVMKGMAAPVMLYHREPAPAIPKVLIKPQANKLSVQQQLANDWLKIGGDLAAVMERHAEESHMTTD